MPDILDAKYFQKRSHLLQHYVRRHRDNDAFYNYDEWELPEGAEALPLLGNEEAIQLPNSFSCQIFRTYGRFVWARLEYKHVNPSGGENQFPRLFQFVIKTPFDSRARPDYHASILDWASGWSSGARRPANCSRAHLTAGDAIEIIHARGKETENLSARSWCPADELKGKAIGDRSFWSSNLRGLTIDYWSGMPKVGRQALEAHYAPRDNTELIAQFPNQVAPARLINRWLNSRGAPPPPPSGE